jgi:hypothetical protein
MISVIICTHNPRPDYFSRVLTALRQQTLPLSEWELLVIDNQSVEPLAGGVDLAWHPAARVIREETLGLTPARLRGIKESSGKLLVFVDDDNILAHDYLSEALQIALDYPNLGAWGGCLRGEFETAPPSWSQRYWPYLGVRQATEDRWSNDPRDWNSQPCGAGLCVRQAVANRYVADVAANPLKQALDRKGSDLSSCGDSDLVQTSRRFGLGFGVFVRLHLVHLIPAWRLSEEYLLRLVQGVTASVHILHFLREGSLPEQRMTWMGRCQYWARMLRLPARERRFARAQRAALQNARKLISAVGHDRN